MAPAGALALFVAVATAVTGCGSVTGVSNGATVKVYVSAPLRGAEAAAGRALCSGAKAALARAGGAAGEVRVKAVCLDASGPGGAWTLASVGANARHATEDTTTVAYIGEPAPQAREQSHPILEAAGIAQLAGSSGASAMNEILEAIRGASSDDPRAALRESLSAG